MGAALPFALEILTALPGLIKAGIDITALLSSSTKALNTMQAEDRGPTDAEWDALHAALKPLEDSIQAAHRDVP